MVAKVADYVGQNYKCGGITRGEVESQTRATITVPPRPTAAPGAVQDPLDVVEWTSEEKASDYQIQYQMDNKNKMFSLV